MLPELFLLLSLILLLLLLWGMIKPTKAFLGSESTRKKVAKVYGLGFIASFVVFVMEVPKSEISASAQPATNLAAGAATPTSVTVSEFLVTTDNSTVTSVLPSIRKLFPGLDKYASQFRDIAVREDHFTTIQFAVPEDAKLPRNDSRGMAAGQTCFVEINKEHTAARIGKSACRALAMDRDVNDPNGNQRWFALGTTQNQFERVDQKTVLLTGPQKNAVRSAKQYLDMAGFSRAGLIGQLSSSAGDGYEVADATVAIDSLNIDWNKQATRSAKQYLDMTGFSCKGLIQQLSSRAGDKYTVSQATHGAQQAGACATK